MEREDIIRMAREAGLHVPYWDEDEDPEKDLPRWTMTSPLPPLLERFAALVAAAERESVMKIVQSMKADLEAKFEQTYMEGAMAGAAKEREKSLQLWMLLDDVDSADDIAKADDAIYRSLCRQAHKKRWAVLTGDEVDAAIRARGEQ